MKIFLTIALFFTTSFLHAQQSIKSIEKGNDLYRQQQFGEAESAYRGALLEDSGSKIAAFNLANTLVKQKKTDEGEKILVTLNDRSNTNDIREKSVYNHGVIFTQQKKLEESIEAYKAALRLNPEDQDARENLQKAMMELKKKNPPKKQDDAKKKQEQQKPEQKPKMNQRQVQQHLKLLEQKEKEVRQRLQKNSSNTGTPQQKDW
jgi:tetratricopeptide (TPR) repeat protein